MTTGAAPPVTGGTPPSTGGTPPSTGGTPPSTGGTPPSTGGTPPTTGPIDPRLKPILVPEKYAQEGWAKEVKDIEDLWTKMAGAQKLLGKDKIVLPGVNATPEERNEFYTKMGRPENIEGYEFRSVEHLQDVARNVELDHGIKKIFFEEGVSKEVGEHIVTRYEELIYDMQKPAIDEAAKREIDFQTLATEVLGEDRASAITAFKSVMRESLGDKAHLAAKIEGMTNDELLPLIVLGKNIHDKYSGETKLPVKPGGIGRMTGDLKTDFQTLSASKRAIKADPNMPVHIRNMKLGNLNAQMMVLGAKAKDAGINLFTQSN